MKTLRIGIRSRDEAFSSLKAKAQMADAGIIHHSEDGFEFCFDATEFDFKLSVVA
jgi:hypothetical protein